MPSEESSSVIYLSLLNLITWRLQIKDPASFQWIKFFLFLYFRYRQDSSVCWVKAGSRLSCKLVITRRLSNHQYSWVSSTASSKFFKLTVQRPKIIKLNLLNHHIILDLKWGQMWPYLGKGGLRWMIKKRVFYHFKHKRV